MGLTDIRAAITVLKVYCAIADRPDDPTAVLEQFRNLEAAYLKLDPQMQEAQRAIETIEALQAWRKGGKRPLDS